MELRASGEGDAGENASDDVDSDDPMDVFAGSYCRYVCCMYVCSCVCVCVCVCVCAYLMDVFAGSYCRYVGG